MSIHSHKTVSLRDLQRNLRASLPKDNEQVLVTNNGSIDYVISPVNSLQVSALGVQAFNVSNTINNQAFNFPNNILDGVTTSASVEINKNNKHNHGKK